MSVRVAASAGFCFGVDRAVGLVEQTVREGKRAVTLGPIIHNHHVVQHFAVLGVREIASPEEVPGRLTTTARTASRAPSMKRCRRAGWRSSMQHARSSAASTVSYRKLRTNSPASRSSSARRSTRRSWPSQAGAGIRSSSRTAKPCRNGSMTTQNDTICHSPWSHRRTSTGSFLWDSCKKIAKKVCTNLEFFDTICKATENRQAEAAALAGAVRRHDRGRRPEKFATPGVWRISAPRIARRSSLWTTRQSWTCRSFGRPEPLASQQELRRLRG